MTDNERRRHQRYALRLTIQLRRGDEVLSADIINASKSGCLVLVAVPLAPGEVLRASIPEMRIPETRLLVLRCQADASGGYTVALHFEPESADERSLARLSGEQWANAHRKWLS